MLAPFACLLVVTLGRLTLGAPFDTVYNRQVGNQWFKDGISKIEEILQIKNINKRAKGVVLFIGDGMGPSTVTAARILDGQLKGGTGEENVLSWEKFPNVGLSKTYNTNQQVPDSAGTATAFMTGVKSQQGVINVDEHVGYKNCSTVAGREVLSIIMMAEMAGLSTGVVTTTRLTHATPATAYAHSGFRDWEGVAPDGCKDIASQVVDFQYGNGLEVLMGGGRKFFLPATVSDPEYPTLMGKRVDGRNLIQEWKDKSVVGGPKFEHVWNQEQFKRLNPKDVDHVLGLFEYDNMQYECKRLKDGSGEPSLNEMAEFAVRVLERNPKGFVLLVEGGRVDHGHHENRPVNALHDAVELARAVERVAAITKEDEVLLIVSADHSHVFTLGGYQVRGNPIFGLAAASVFENKIVADDGKPFASLSYANGPGAELNKLRANLTGLDLSVPDTAFQALVPLVDDTHGGEDVGIYARGPQSHAIRGVVEQNVIFHVMDFALCLSDSKQKICREQEMLRSSSVRLSRNSWLLAVGASFALSWLTARR